MRRAFAYLGVLLLLVGAAVGLVWYTSPASDTLVANGPVLPQFLAEGQPGDAFGLGQGLAFSSPYGAPGSPITYHISVQYGDAQAVSYVQACPTDQTLTCSTSPGAGDPIFLTLHGGSAKGTFRGVAGEWYILVSNEPIVASVTVDPQPLQLSEEITGAALFFGGAGLLVVGLVLRDPKNRPAPRVARIKRTLYFFVQSKLAVFGLAILLFFVSVAVLSPVLAPASGPTSTPTSGNGDTLALYCSWDPSTFNPSPPAGCQYPQCVYPANAPAPLPGNCLPYSVQGNPPEGEPGSLAPTWSGLSLGVLPMGSILYSQQYFFNTYQGLVRATPWDLLIAGTIVSFGAMVGILLGSLAGYRGGLVDETIMRVTDVFLSIPGLFLILILLAVFTSDIPGSTMARVLLLIGAFLVTFWPTYTRIVRGQVLVTREQKYVEAAHASGARSSRVLVRHVIPNSIYPVFVSMSLDIGTIPLVLGAIAFLGFGGYVFPATTGLFPEWGVLSAWTVSTSSNAINNIYTTIISGAPLPWWQILFPGLALFLFALSVNFLADGLRDALDPRLRR